MHRSRVALGTVLPTGARGLAGPDLIGDSIRCGAEAIVHPESALHSAYEHHTGRPGAPPLRRDLPIPLRLAWSESGSISHPTQLVKANQEWTVEP
jgi:hypothetical protein